jgi:hypothetical protein
MTDLPVIMSGPMVRRTWDGFKTETRRLLYAERKARGGRVPGSASFIPAHPAPLGNPMKGTYWTLSGWHKAKVGDRLWVKERLSSHGHFGFPLSFGPEIREIDGTRIWSYFADGIPGVTNSRPSIHCPRDFSRLTLVVTATKIERLQDISEADAQAEGARRFDDIPGTHPYPASEDRWSMEMPTSTDTCLGSARAAFGNYWSKLHGSASWHENPWVVALTFVVRRCNVDRLGSV